MSKKRKCFIAGSLTVLMFTAIIAYRTVSDLKDIPKSFYKIITDSHNIQALDRHGQALNVTYQNQWNVHNITSLHQTPDFLKKAFIISEDKNFYEHRGIDWLARSAAVITNIEHLRAVRGASTITEQVVRMINPRPRTIWSRWLEGFEAVELEKYFSKNEILEFYLNQVPYAANRRGVKQAALYYFNRDLDTLSKKEMLALAVLVRAPSSMDLWKNSKRVDRAITNLSERLISNKIINQKEKNIILNQNFHLERPTLSVAAPEFIKHIKGHHLIDNAGWPKVKTTLDASLQNKAQDIVDHRLHFLRSKNVNNAAALVVDHQTSEILAWVVAGKNNNQTPGRFIDAVTTPRQPGSTLKPFLYGLALQKGWTAATIIDDSPLTDTVGNGLHNYRNYSNSFYGPITVREALGNSLNIPAVRTLQYVGIENYLNYLRNFGLDKLNNHPDYYGDGIALGNAEITLFELVQAYSALANHGNFHSLKVFIDNFENENSRQVLSPEIASLVANILSDPKARSLEFGENSVLQLPIETAVKTGTSSDYRDSWAFGFNYRYTVGVWLGNLNQEPMDGITGSTGPALILRSIFSELTKYKDTQALGIHKKLQKREVCEVNQDKNQNCKRYTEWFVSGTEPEPRKQFALKNKIELTRPTENLHLAYDPRIPKESQAFEFFVKGLEPKDQVEWIIDGKTIYTEGGKYIWPLKKGIHDLLVSVWRNNQIIKEFEEVKFYVK